MTSTNALRVRSFTHHTPIQRASTRTNWRKTKKLVKSLILINYFIPFTKMLCVCVLCVCVCRQSTATATGRRKKMSVHLFLLSFVSLTFVNIHIDVDHRHTCIFGLLRSWRTKKDTRTKTETKSRTLALTQKHVRTRAQNWEQNKMEKGHSECSFQINLCNDDNLKYK